MLQNVYFLAKIGADTAENEQHFAENLPKIGNRRGGRRRTAACGIRRPVVAVQPAYPHAAILGKGSCVFLDQEV